MWGDIKISSCSFLDFSKQWISYEESISDLFSLWKPLQFSLLANSFHRWDLSGQTTIWFLNRGYYVTLICHNNVY